MNIPNTPDKPFLNYHQQIAKLRDHNIIVEDEAYAINILKSVPYYTLVNGNRKAFSSTNLYPNGTTFETLYTVHLISTDLSNILLKNVLIAERAFKAKLAYTVAKNYGVCTDIDDSNNLNPDDYLFKGNYINPKHMRSNILGRIKAEATAHPNESFIHYRDTKNHIPPWILIDNIPFGLAIKWYTLLKSTDKEAIVNDYPFSDTLSMEKRKELLKDSLKILQSFRNTFAHGGRVIGVTSDTRLSKDQITALSFGSVSKDIIKKGYAQNDLTALLLIMANMVESYSMNNLYIDLRKLFYDYTAANIRFSGKTIYEVYSLPKDIFKYLTQITIHRG